MSSKVSLQPNPIQEKRLRCCAPANNWQTELIVVLSTVITSLWYAKKTKSVENKIFALLMINPNKKGKKHDPRRTSDQEAKL